MNHLPTPEPLFDADTAPYWRAAARGELVLPRCAECRTYVWYPRPLCPIDLSPVEWTPVSGNGVVYSHTVVHRGERAFAGVAPFVLAYVELDEGPRIMTNVVGCDPTEVAIGLAVRVTFDQVDGAEDLALPRFTPADRGGSTRSREVTPR